MGTGRKGGPLTYTTLIDGRPILPTSLLVHILRRSFIYFTTRARLPLLPLYGRVGPGRYIKCPTSDKTTVGELLGHLKGRLANRATAADILIASIRKEGAVGRAEGDEEEGSNSKDGVS